MATTESSARNDDNNAASKTVSNPVDLRANSALLIVDMQNGFCHPKGSFGKHGLDVARHSTVIPAINQLRQTCHSRDIPVIFLRLGFAEDYSDAGILMEQMPGLREARGFMRDTWDWEIVDELKPEADRDEIVVEKTRNTGFWQTKLAEELKVRGVEQVVVTGVGTNVCVESTVRDAFTSGTRVVVVTDATNTLSEEEHRASLLGMKYFAQLATTTDVVAALETLKQGQKES